MGEPGGLESLDQLGGVLVPSRGVQRHRLVEDPIERVRHLGVAPRGGLVSPLLLRLQHLVGGRAGERSLAGQEMVHGGAQRVDVAAVVHVLGVARLLHRHVRRGSGPRPDLCQATVVIHDLGEAEVGQLHLAVTRDHDVRRLDVAVQDIPRMRMVQRPRDVGNDPDRVANREPARALQVVVEAVAIDELHREVVQPVLFADGDAAHDVGVIQLHRHARFADEAVHEALVTGDVRREDLQRHVAVKAELMGLVDDAHAAFAELVDDPEVLQGFADRAAEVESLVDPAGRLRRPRGWHGRSRIAIYHRAALSGSPERRVTLLASISAGARVRPKARPLRAGASGRAGTFGCWRASTASLHPADDVIADRVPYCSA